jgi:hypothetical protein
MVMAIWVHADQRRIRARRPGRGQQQYEEEEILLLICKKGEEH